MFDYFEAYDTTKKQTAFNSELFFKRPSTNDILQIVLDFARENGTKLEQIRLYRYKTKKAWEKAGREWANKIDFWGV